MALHTSPTLNATAPFPHVCGVTVTLGIIGKKWTILILHSLCDGTKRFGELQRSLSGISPRTLSLRLQQLEADGIVTKTVYAQIPLKVEYSLTAKGKSLRHIIELMNAWGQSHGHHSNKTRSTTSL